MSELLPIVWQLCMGLSLAACAGLRAFLPLFFTGLAARLGWIPLFDRFEWLASDAALIAFGVAVVLEVLGDKFPWVDHILDSAALIIKPTAGTIAVVSVVTELDSLTAAVVGIVLGGGIAGVVHLGKAKLRVASTVLTGGLANPVLSVAEDGVALAGIGMALWVPLLAILVLPALAFAVARIASRRRRQHGESVDVST